MKKLFVLLTALMMSMAAAALAKPIETEFQLAFHEGLTKPFILEMEDEWFLRSSDSYQHDLAQLSVGLAMSAFRMDAEDYTEKDEVLRQFLEGAGFVSYAEEEFDKPTSKETIATGIAMRELPDGSVLLAVAVSGQGYVNEWMSNFSVGSGGRHLGFSKASDKVIDRIYAYINRHELSEKRVKVWLSGFSRAAAVSNMTAAKLIEGGKIAPNDVFCYAFAVPNNTTEPIAYPQIYNICGSMDVVPMVPFSNWGFGRYGVTLYLPARELDIRYDEKVPAAIEKYREIMGSDAGFASSPQINWLLSKFLELFYDIIPDAEHYAGQFQDILIGTYAAEGGLAGKLNFLYERIMENEKIVSALKREGMDASMLFQDVLYTFLAEISGTDEASWLNELESGKTIIHEHWPQIYAAWMFSTEDPDVLFGHAEEYTRVILSGNLGYDIYTVEGENVLDKIPAFYIGNQAVLSIPADKDYVVVMVTGEGDGQIALRRHSPREISRILEVTDGYYFSDDERIEIWVPASGDAMVFLDGIQIPTEKLTGPASVCAELDLDGNEVGAGLREDMAYLLTEILPHMVSFVIVVCYTVICVIRYMVKRRRDALLPVAKRKRILLRFMGAMAFVFSMMHLFNYMVLIIWYQKVVVGNALAMRAIRFLGFTQRSYEAGSVVIYLVLAGLCLRACNHRISRIRGRRISMMLAVLRTIVIAGAVYSRSITPLKIVWFCAGLAYVGVFLYVRDDKKAKGHRELQAH